MSTNIRRISYILASWVIFWTTNLSIYPTQASSNISRANSIKLSSDLVSDMPKLKPIQSSPDPKIAVVRETISSQPINKPQPAKLNHPIQSTQSVHSIRSTSQTKSTQIIQKIPVMKKASSSLKTETLKILGKNLPIFPVQHTEIDSRNFVARYKDKFLYGHNSTKVFGSLKNLRSGDIFQIEGPQGIKKYQVSLNSTFTKNQTQSLMWAITHANYRGKSYDLSLMTCAGDPLPNQDATHRTVIFAISLN